MLTVSKFRNMARKDVIIFTGCRRQPDDDVNMSFKWLYVKVSWISQLPNIFESSDVTKRLRIVVSASGMLAFQSTSLSSAKVSNSGFFNLISSLSSLTKADGEIRTAKA